MKLHEFLISTAMRAPSGDNTQPWRFSVDPRARRLTAEVDPSRDPSPMNAGQRMSRIALGAVLENLLTALERVQGRSDVALSEDGNGFVLQYDGPEEASLADADPLVSRVTNRREYDARQLAPEVQTRLTGVVPRRAGASLGWAMDRKQIQALAEIVSAADRLMFATAPMRKAFLANVRFDAPPHEEVAEGLSLASLELSNGAARGMKLVGGLGDFLFKFLGGPREFAKPARKLIASSSGMCVVVAPDDSPWTDIEVGALTQQVWLEFTRIGMSAQPMMSLAVLSGALRFAPGEIPGLPADVIERLLAQLQEALPGVSPGRPGFLLRFGYAPPPSGRTGRRNSTDVCRFETDASHEHFEVTHVPG